VADILEAIAEALEAAAAVLRRGAAALQVNVPDAQEKRTLAEPARYIHPKLGERQEQMLPLLAAAGEDGATSGDIARALEYDHTNASITLKAMLKARLLLRDETAVPYRYRLVPDLLA
jgi:DNA-binding MarR family transcriptional regulator